MARAAAPPPLDNNVHLDLRVPWGATLHCLCDYGAAPLEHMRPLLRLLPFASFARLLIGHRDLENWRLA